MWRHGARTVVMAFDDYAHVPCAKAITQAARRQNLPPFPFRETDPLPDTPPDPWAPAMANRLFKARVQRLVCESLPEMLECPSSSKGTTMMMAADDPLLLPSSSPPQQEEEEPYTLIIDWRGPEAHVFTWDPATGAPLQCVQAPRAPIGEADVKLIWWCQNARAFLQKKKEEEAAAPPMRIHMLVEATDGDYIPIALLTLVSASSQQQQDAATVRDISILRLRVGGNGGSNTKNNPYYEWVHALRLAQSLCLRCTGSAFDAYPAADRSNLFHALVVLIGLTGTDFSRGLPQIGPKKFAKILPRALRAVRGTIVMSSHPPTLHPALALDSILALVYGMSFQKHVRHMQTYHSVLSQLRTAPGLSSTIKDRLPSVSRALCTLRNAQFLLHYWNGYAPSDSELLASPRRFGFRRKNGEGRKRTRDEMEETSGSSSILTTAAATMMRTNPLAPEIEWDDDDEATTEAWEEDGGEGGHGGGH